ncbi:hypothetical protein CEP54_012576 [Fusarium duplospermum]|uniref:TRP C-terminal domain-containing protein n=1 Tax=Fusarium duplospermum TaxID=1325734 RepID=A0A428P820_9HYPO|nr:hypothetical protein CEP54_012576 [Fusarium duplospermum]
MVSLLMRALALLVFLVSRVSAAYLHWDSCNDASPLNSTFNGSPRLSVGVVPLGSEGNSALNLDISFWTTPADCVAAASTISHGEIEIRLLSGSFVREIPVNGSCQRFTSVEGVSGSVLDIPIAIDDIGHIPALSTIGLKIRLFDDIYTTARLCQSTTVMPALGHSATTAIRAVSSTILGIAVVVGLLRTIWDDAISITDAPHKFRAGTVLPEVGECIHFFQFIFLAGCLSIHYPSFYQPIIGQLHWFTLFSNGNIDRGPSYVGIRDGVYETNGTYVNVSGLDLMNQTIGGPHQLTVTWLNMVLFITIIVLTGALGLQLYYYTSRRPGASKHAKDQPGLIQLYGQVLWFVLWCFAPPLITLSIYQLACLASEPLLYAFLALSAISITLATLRWVSRRLTILRLGALTFDTSQRRRPVSTPGGFEGHDRGCVQLSVALMCIQAATVGGLQSSGLTQLPKDKSLDPLFGS